MLPDSRVSVIWVLVGTSLWRCAPEQLRMASEQEVITELLEKGKAVIEEVMKGLRRFVDVAREHDPGDQDGLPPEPWLDGAAEPEPGEAEAQPPQQWEDTLENAADEWAARRAASREREARRPSRSRTPEGPAARTTVREQIEQWQQMASANAARKLEGLPRMRRMPEDIEFGEVPDTWEIDEENRMLIRHHHGDPNRIGNCPVPMDQFTGKRVTIWTTPRGSTGSFVDQWIGTRTDPERQHHNRWKGSTHLEIKEGYDVLAPKRQEFENPPAPTTKRAKESRMKSNREPSGSRGGQDATQETATSSTTPSPLGAVLSIEQDAAQETATSSTIPSPLGVPSDRQPDVFSLVEGDKIRALDAETVHLVQTRIEQLENDTKQAITLNALRMEVKRMQREESDLIEGRGHGCGVRRGGPELVRGVEHHVCQDQVGVEFGGKGGELQPGPQGPGENGRSHGQGNL